MNRVIDSLLLFENGEVEMKLGVPSFQFPIPFKNYESDRNFR
ncbi:hypothetical protein [Coleofasciculus sp. FACHB-SPT36]|nr:hypothetical protein [Coleofasciculus sp. FACHB-SPT36]